MKRIDRRLHKKAIFNVWHCMQTNCITDVEKL